MRRTLRLVSLALVLCLVPVAALAEPGGLRDDLDRTTQQRERAQEQLRDARQREGSAREQLGQIEAELEEAQAALAELEAALEDAHAEVEAADQRAAEARERLTEVRETVAELEADHDEKRARLDNRVRAAFKFGQVSFADTLTTAADMADFLNSNTYVSHVLAGDRELIEEVAALLAEVEVQRAEAQRLRVEAERETELAEAAAAALEQALEDQAELTAVVEERRQERASALEALRDDRASLEGHLAGLEAESSRIQSQLAAIARQQEAERQRQEEQRRREEEERQRREQEQREREASEACEQARDSGDEDAVREACGETGSGSGSGSGSETGSETPTDPPPSTGGWTRPVPGAMTSPFGPRPSLGGFHYGVDLRGDVGTPIRAARSGTVVTVVGSCHPTNSWTCGGGFGNYVVIAHDSGFATVYAHQASVGVGTGQRVQAGQVIGQVGNSGRSYGPHLHFEVYDQGVRKNPCNYIGC